MVPPGLRQCLSNTITPLRGFSVYLWGYFSSPINHTGTENTYCTEKNLRLTNFRGLGAVDAEFAEAMIQRRAVHAETRGGAGGSANHPLRIVENLENVVALDCLEIGAVRGSRGSRSLLQFRQRDFQGRAT